MTKSPELFRAKESIDLTKVIPVSAELQHVVLRCIISPLPVPGEPKMFALQSYRYPKFKKLFPYRGIKLTNHSGELGTTGPALLQLSLAICLELYSTSKAIAIHREFAGKYLMTLPSGEFYKSIYVPV